MPVEILHLAFANFPADPRVRREVAALRDTGRGVAVVALRGANERAVERRDGVVIIRVPGRKSRGGFISYLAEYAAFVWRCRRLVAHHRALRRVRIVHIHTLPDFLLWAALPAAFYGLDVAIRALARVRSERLDARLTILGDGPERGELQRLAADLSLDVVAFESPIPQSALPARLARCAAGVVPTLLDDMTRYSLSNKL